MTTYLIRLEPVQFDELDCQPQILNATETQTFTTAQLAEACKQEPQLFNGQQITITNGIVTTTNPTLTTNLSQVNGGVNGGGGVVNLQQNAINTVTITNGANGAINLVNACGPTGSNGELVGAQVLNCYNSGTMQIVQLKNPIDFNESMDSSNDNSNKSGEITSPAIVICEKIKEHQRKLNKYVRIRFREEFGKNFLMEHDLHECDKNKFDQLRKEALTLFKPPGVSERTAWARAKQSLRLMRNAMLKS